MLTTHKKRMIIFENLWDALFPTGARKKNEARGKLCVSLVCLRGALRKCGRLWEVPAPPLDERPLAQRKFEFVIWKRYFTFLRGSKVRRRRQSYTASRTRENPSLTPAAVVCREREKNNILTLFPIEQPQMLWRKKVSKIEIRNFVRNYVPDFENHHDLTKSIFFK